MSFLGFPLLFFSGIFPIVLPLDVLRSRPLKRTYKGAPERVRETIRSFLDKNGKPPPMWEPPSPVVSSLEEIARIWMTVLERLAHKSVQMLSLTTRWSSNRLTPLDL